jgi:hypothetical protein
MQGLQIIARAIHGLTNDSGIAAAYIDIEITPLKSLPNAVPNWDYYAVYNLSVQTLDGMGFQIIKSHEAHGQVLNFLGNSKDEDSEMVVSQPTRYPRRPQSRWFVQRESLKKN